MKASSMVATFLFYLLLHLPAYAQSASGNLEVFGGSASGGGDGGDLIYTPTCEAYAPGLQSTDFVTLTQEMWVDGTLLGPSETQSGTGDVSFVIQRTLPAKPHDQSVMCFFYFTFQNDNYSGNGSGSDGPKIAWGAGPPQLEIRANAFIQQNWVCKPAFCDDIFNGNWRGFSANGASNSKLSSTTHVANTGLSSPVLQNYSAQGGWSEKYEKSSTLVPCPQGECISDAARADWAPGSPMKQEWATGAGWGECNGEELGAFIDGPQDARSRAEVHCFYKADNPLMLSPYVDIDFTIQLKFGFSVADYTISGCHDAFPSYEIYINGQTVHTATESGNAWDLLGHCDSYISKSGTIGG